MLWDTASFFLSMSTQAGDCSLGHSQCFVRGFDGTGTHGTVPQNPHWYRTWCNVPERYACSPSRPPEGSHSTGDECRHVRTVPRWHYGHCNRWVRELASERDSRTHFSVFSITEGFLPVNSRADFMSLHLMPLWRFVYALVLQPND